MGLIIAIHVITCILLIIIILIQAGRGGGLVEGFSNVESMFGTKTNAFLTRATTVLAILFFLTCLSLALLSARQSRSLMKDIQVEPPAKSTAASATTAATAPATKEVNPAAPATAAEAAKQAPQEVPKAAEQPVKAR